MQFEIGHINSKHEEWIAPTSDTNRRSYCTLIERVVCLDNLDRSASCRWTRSHRNALVAYRNVPDYNCMNSGYSRTSTDFLFFHRVRTRWLVQIQYIKHHTNLSRLNRDNQNAPVAIYVKTQISRYYKYEFPSLTLTIGWELSQR